MFMIVGFCRGKQKQFVFGNSYGIFITHSSARIVKRTSEVE